MSVLSEGLFVFDNPEIDLAALPRAADVDWLPLDKKLVRKNVVGALIVLVINAVFIGVLYAILTTAFRAGGVDVSIWWVWLLLPVIGIPMLVWPVISYPYMGYAVRDKDIVYKAGVLFRKVTTIPYNRIQHVEKDSTPLDRRYELANLKIYTAGGSGGDLKINGLHADTAERLRILILDKVGAIVERH